MQLMQYEEARQAWQADADERVLDEAGRGLAAASGEVIHYTKELTEEMKELEERRYKS
jgi:hypothetical protein